MTISAAGALALELHPVSPTRWVATFYPVVETGAGRWAEVTWVLHERLLPLTHGPRAAARWLEVRSPDPTHSCYAHYPAWSTALAAGYLAALTAHDAQDMEQPLSTQDAQRLRETTVVVPAGQLSEWVLNDIEEETAPVHG